MTERLTVVPEELRRAAREHLETADRLAAVPAGNAEVMACLESLGPIFGEFRDAGRELLEQRRACYAEQAAAHTDLAQRLSSAADVWEQHDADVADRLRRVAKDEP